MKCQINKYTSCEISNSEIERFAHLPIDQIKRILDFSRYYYIIKDVPNFNGNIVLCGSDTGQRQFHSNPYTIAAYSFGNKSGLFGNSRLLKSPDSTGVGSCKR